jgi:hypothetical protein
VHTFIAANQAIRDENYDGAVVACSLGTHSFTERRCWRRLLTRTCIALPPKTGALALYHTALRQEPSNTFMLVARAKAFRRVRKLDHALADANRVIKLQPENFAGYLERAHAILHMAAKAMAGSGHQKELISLSYAAYLDVLQVAHC